MERDYIYYSHTRTLCDECLKVIDGKIVYNKEGVFIEKSCPICGVRLELLEEDEKYHRQKVLYDKVGTKSKCQTEYKSGCPFDCGICEAHDQHTCIGLIEITKKCSLSCEMCYAKSGGHEELSLERIDKMLDFYLEAEGGTAEILQISGGEPTLHEGIFDIIRMARQKGIKYVMINTNGIKIAEDESFAEKLSEFKGEFEVYLQFDGLDDSVYKKLRHTGLLETKRRALANLQKHGVPTTLVCTVAKGINDDKLGELITFAMNEEIVRGINFQPQSFYGDCRPENNRITLSGVLKRIEEQMNGIIRMSDFIPLPCNAERVALTYMFKRKNGFVPITRGKDMTEYKDAIGSTFMFNIDDTMNSLKERFDSFNIGSCCGLAEDIAKYIPKNFILKSKTDKIKFVNENTFRISVSYFVDRFNFDMKSMQKECVHVITPDLKRIPFSSYNMLHRDKYDS